MARNLSEELMRDLYAEGNDNLGARLGRACVDAHICASHVALVMDVSRMTVHSWFRGNNVRLRYREAIEALIVTIKRDTEARVLPAHNLATSREYVTKLHADKHSDVTQTTL
jgi:hypothetical protein